MYQVLKLPYAWYALFAEEDLALQSFARLLFFHFLDGIVFILYFLFDEPNHPITAISTRTM